MHARARFPIPRVYLGSVPRIPRAHWSGSAPAPRLPLSVMAIAAVPDVESEHIVSAHRGGRSWGTLMVILALLLVALQRSTLDAITCMPDAVVPIGPVVGIACKWSSLRDARTRTTGEWNSFRAPVGQRQPRYCTTSDAVGEWNSFRALTGGWTMRGSPESVPGMTTSTTNQSWLSPTQFTAGRILRQPDCPECVYHASNTPIIAGSVTITEPMCAVRLCRRTVQSTLVASGIRSARPQRRGHLHGVEFAPRRCIGVARAMRLDPSW